MPETKKETVRLEAAAWSTAVRVPRVLYVCSECHGSFQWFVGDDVIPPNYCPHCGKPAETI
jgi:hypothetical protein